MSWWTDNFYGTEQGKTWSKNAYGSWLASFVQKGFTGAAGSGTLGRMSNTTYTGCDIRIMAHGRNEELKSELLELSTVNTFSYSLHRPKSPVRALGYVNAKGYARGTRTIAGSIIFTIFNKHPLSDFAVSGSDDVTPHITKMEKKNANRVLLDQLPPFDVTIIFVNEYGNISRQAFYGIDISTEGQVLSISDLMIENSVNYTCLHMDPMMPIVDLFTFMGGLDDLEAKGIAQLFEDAYAIPDPAARLDEIESLNAKYNTIISRAIIDLGIEGNPLQTTLQSVVKDERSKQILKASSERFR